MKLGKVQTLQIYNKHLDLFNCSPPLSLWNNCLKNIRFLGDFLLKEPLVVTLSETGAITFKKHVVEQSMNVSKFIRHN